MQGIDTNYGAPFGVGGDNPKSKEVTSWQLCSSGSLIVATLYHSKSYPWQPQVVEQNVFFLPTTEVSAVVSESRFCINPWTALAQIRESR